MTQDLKATYETIDALQLEGDYNELRQLAQYVIDAITNDGESLYVKFNEDLFLKLNSGAGLVPSVKYDIDSGEPTK